jgi:hypothetical protein
MLKFESKSAYFTGSSEAAELLGLVDSVWGLDGKTVLEPSVGSGVFPLSSERLRYNLTWITNELYPDQTNYDPDYTEDFLTLPVQKVDLVIGNPPYSGRVTYEGIKMSLSDAFIHRSLEWADRVAFVLPAAALRPKPLSLLPEGVGLKMWTVPRRSEYAVSGGGSGGLKSVKTTICLYERGNYSKYPFSSNPVPGLEWVKRGDPRATHAVSRIMPSGRARALDGSWGTLNPFSDELQCVITDPRIEAILATKAVQTYYDYVSSSCSNLGIENLNWFISQMLK